MPNLSRTPPIKYQRDRSLSAGRSGNSNKRKAEGSAEKERKSRSQSKKPNISREFKQVNEKIIHDKSNSSQQVNKNKTTPKTKTGKRPPSETHCSGCGIVFDDDNCMLCSCCRRWFHATCVNLTADEITAFTLLGDKAHWYCDNCDAGAKELFEQNV